MANQSIYNAFERMWQHVINVLNNIKIPINTSELTNDSGFLTQSEMETYVNESILGGEW